MLLEQEKTILLSFRIMVITPDFGSGYVGSIPAGTTINKKLNSSFSISRQCWSERLNKSANLLMKLVNSGIVFYILF